MGFFDEAVDTTKDFVNKAVKKTTETIEVQKIKFAISKKKDQINKTLAVLGENYYQVNSGDSSKLETCEMLCEKVSVLKDELKELKQKLYTAQSVKVCANCGKENFGLNKTCTICGTEL